MDQVPLQTEVPGLRTHDFQIMTAHFIHGDTCSNHLAIGDLSDIPFSAGVTIVKPGIGTLSSGKIAAFGHFAVAIANHYN